MKRFDKFLDKVWEHISETPLSCGIAIRKVLAAKRTRNTKQFRFCSRGEPFTCESDVWSIIQIAQENPDIKFWVPTRAWRNKRLRSVIEKNAFCFDNIFIQASTDPSTPVPPDGWSEMFFGDDEAIKDRVKCRKTFNHEEGICGTKCKTCFTKGKRVILKQH